MGSTKIESGSTTTTTPTAEETELNKLQLEQQKAIQPYAIPLQQQAYSLGQLLLKGQPLPGYLEPLPQGATAQEIPLSAGVFGEDLTNEIVQQSLRDIFPQFQAMGLPVESGVAQSIAGRTAGDIRRQVGESNIERQLGIREANINTQMTTQYQNLNNLLNLLNLAVGGQAQIQQPVISTGQGLGQRLAGLRTITGNQSQDTQYSFFTNPFISSMGQGLGQSVGSALIGKGCWVAKEIFGSWEHPKTIFARYYINSIAPVWFRNFYIKFGERIAKFIHNKPVIKLLLRPLFEFFSKEGVKYAFIN